MEDQALVLPETDDGRLLFIVPWRGLALVGTTDTPYGGDPARVRPEQADVEYLERHLHRYLDVAGVSPLAAFAGLRTLPRTRGSTSGASREHRIVEQGAGVFRVVGGKLSSARAIGTEVVDRVCAHLRIDRPSRTADEPLVGTGMDGALRIRLRAETGQMGLPETYTDQLIGRYGTEAATVLRLMERRPELRTLMNPAPVSAAEVVYTARHESVASIGDFALRRTNLALYSTDHGRPWARLIASTLAGELDWPARRAENAISDYSRELAGMGL